MKISSPLLSSCIPRRRNESGMIPSLSYAVFLIVISDSVIAAIPINDPISIISGRMVCIQPVQAGNTVNIEKVGSYSAYFCTHRYKHPAKLLYIWFAGGIIYGGTSRWPEQQP